MEPVTRIEPQAWMTATATGRVMDALQSSGVAARFVGGCVRDALSGRAVNDVDVATPLPPREVMALLGAADLKVVPTGIDHGTVMAVVDGAHYEITTLRVDVETDGRRAKVAFTDDWDSDAARRDFTINALSCSAAGDVYDPCGGLADLQAGRVRFVGDPEQRIGEDVLRLLRFYRFQAYFGRTAPDGAARAACAKLAHLLPGLSGERVAQETRRLLAATEPASAVRMMAEDGVLAQILPEATAIDRLAALVIVEKGAGGGADPERRLAALLAADVAGATAVAERLRLSNATRERLQSLAAPAAPLGPDMKPAEQRRRLYALGAARYRDRALLDWAAAVAAVAAGRDLNRSANAAWQALLARADTWTPPKFPLVGGDVLRLGVAGGPEVGRYLAAVEAWWADGDFTADRRACLRQLRHRVASRDES